MLIWMRVWYIWAVYDAGMFGTARVARKSMPQLATRPSTVVFKQNIHRYHFKFYRLSATPPRVRQFALDQFFEKNISKKDSRLQNTFLSFSTKNEQKKDSPGRFHDRKSPISPPEHCKKSNARDLRSSRTSSGTSSSRR